MKVEDLYIDEAEDEYIDDDDYTAEDWDAYEEDLNRRVQNELEEERRRAR